MKKTSLHLNIAENDVELKQKFEISKNDTVEGKLMDIFAQLFNGLIKIGIIIPNKNFSFNDGP